MKKIFIIMFTAVVFFMTAACGNVKYNALTYFTVSAKFPLVAVYACDYSSAVVSINA